MKRTLLSQALAVFMSTSLVASMGEEDPSQGAPCISSLTGQKRSHNDLGKGKEEDNGAVKKPKSDATVNMATQEAASQTIVLSSPLELLPNELLVYISRFLPHKDFLSFAAMNKPTREVLFATYFQDPIPPRTWRLALDFDEGARAGSTGLIFENVVMQRVMRDLLVMFKSQEANRALDFKNTLAHFNDFTYKGQTLDKTPLGRFMAGIRKTNPDFLDLRELGGHEHFGDGDALFLNMLHYIKSRFAKNPETLPHHRAPDQARMLSPQERLFKADGLRNEIAVLVNKSAPDATRALKIEELLENFDDFIPSGDTLLFAYTFHRASEAVADTAQKSSFLARSAQLMERYYTDTETLDVGKIYDLACQYYNAAYTSANPKDKARYYLKSAQWWEAYFEQNPAPATNDYRVAANALSTGARALRGTQDHAPLTMKAADLWDLYLEQNPLPTLMDAETAAQTYRHAALLSQDPQQNLAYLLKADALFKRYLLKETRPNAQTVAKAQEVAALL
ncbi:MAG: hypothetical protein LCH26_08190, partial [Proteobacteria bacterium]|nr:hypothetical protein [Pseudomonadota bacterium]